MNGPRDAVGRVCQYTAPIGNKPIQAILTHVQPDGTACLHIAGAELEAVPFTSAPAGTDEAKGKWAWPRK